MMGTMRLPNGCLLAARFLEISFELFDLALEREPFELRETIDFAESRQEHLDLQKGHCARLTEMLFARVLVVGPCRGDRLELVMQLAQLGGELAQMVLPYRP